MTRVGRYGAAHALVRAQLSSALGRGGLQALYGYPTPQAMRDALRSIGYGPSAGPSESFLPRLVALGGAVLRLMEGRERDLLREYLRRLEVENVKLLLRAVGVSSDRLDEFAAHLLLLAGVGTFDAPALLGVRDLPTLVEELAHTPYGPALRTALHTADGAGPFQLEVAVELNYYDRLWAATTELREADGAEARRLLGTLFDVLNLGWVARYRDAVGLFPEEILNLTLRQGRWLTLDVRRRLAQGPAGAWTAALVATPYQSLGPIIEAQGFDRARAQLWHMVARESERTLFRYPFTIGVPLACLMIHEIELRDLDTLLAAKRLGVPPQEAMERMATMRR